ncbi:hypothetical protein GGP41_001897 [Bipolaris sorokiniana]|uniref:Intradiol ring-cleavage dioxygenases domain-containing protein n=1 Tax=Cochliobolus sativus TaxID=45130 RepID=A0A8H6DZ24_COCSA|nr:hypothetical protein GGP41_001897 [Bipolaris sorokiniana]
MTNGEPGVPLTADIQIIIVDTCEPIPQICLEAWHCNFDVYSGIVTNGNGDSSNKPNLKATFPRTISLSDDDVVINFNAVFPGHYIGRTTRVHVLVRSGTSLNAKSTLRGSNIVHVRQVYFDRDLILLFEPQEPYSRNTQELTTNADDDILAEEAVQVLLGDNLSYGIFAWIAFGIDVTWSHDISLTIYYTSERGVQDEEFSSLSGGPPPNGTAPIGNTNTRTGRL